MHRILPLTGLLAALLVSSGARLAGEGASYQGITQPVVDVALSLPVAGIMVARHCKEGDFVHRGDVILELDDRLEALEVDRRRFVMENAKADWESTRAVFDKTTSISRDELHKKETDYRVATAEWQIAQEEVQRRKLTAPADGVITELNLHVGESCTAYQPIAHLVDTRQCYFVSNVDASLSVHLSVGQKVSLAIGSAGAPLTVQGSVVFVSPVVDSASGLQRVKVLFDNEDGRIRPGLAAQLQAN